VIVELQRKEQLVYVINVHLSGGQDKEQERMNQIKSAFKYLKKRIAQSKPLHYALFVAGDFNHNTDNVNEVTKLLIAEGLVKSFGKSHLKFTHMWGQVDDSISCVSVFSLLSFSLGPVFAVYRQYFLFLFSFSGGAAGSLCGLDGAAASRISQLVASLRPRPARGPLSPQTTTGKTGIKKLFILDHSESRVDEVADEKVVGVKGALYHQGGGAGLFPNVDTFVNHQHSIFKRTAKSFFVQRRFEVFQRRLADKYIPMSVIILFLGIFSVLPVNRT
jgi:hypothetical protein